MRNSSKHKIQLMDIFTRTLNNVDQIVRFARDHHPDTAMVAITFERLNLPAFVNSWKVDTLQAVSKREGRIELHVNDISASVQAIVHTANKNCQEKCEDAKAYKDLIKLAESKKRLDWHHLVDLES
ncbi:uncharacterized protein V1513DRAFT_77718 [Lipomyces chichibuensis]|uniref:uncharacterized protein n=1 Tax=Lipomyces chichibuensis TaxID=1546026 RepID=UPI0033430FB8